MFLVKRRTYAKYFIKIKASGIFLQEAKYEANIKKFLKTKVIKQTCQTQ